MEVGVKPRSKNKSAEDFVSVGTYRITKSLSVILIIYTNEYRRKSIARKKLTFEVRWDPFSFSSWSASASSVAFS